MLKLISLLVLVASANAFWSGCNLAGVLTPTDVQSPFCGATSCTIARGQTLIANAFFTPVRAHLRLDVTVTAFVFGIGINLPIDPPHDNACGFLFNPTTGAEAPCPTVPGTPLRWQLEYTLPTTFPTFNNARVRFELRESGVLEMCADINQVTLT